MAMTETAWLVSSAQERGYEWDRELARRIGGKAHKGSGNRPYQVLDASVGSLVISGKHTDAESMRLTAGVVDEATRAVLGPESAAAGRSSLIAVHFGFDMSGPALAVADLDTVLSWLKSPPQIIPASTQESVRASIRMPPSMR